MSVETFVLVCGVYAIGVYITAFVLGMMDAMCRIGDDDADWFMSMFWPICVLILIVMGLGMLFKFSVARLKSRFSEMPRFVQRTWKCIRTAIFAISLLFRPVKFGKVVGKLIFRNRV